MFRTLDGYYRPRIKKKTHHNNNNNKLITVCTQL